MAESKTIIINDAPPGFLKRRNMRGHFAKFGTIVKTQILDSSSAVVSFEKLEDAKKALKNGSVWKDTNLKIGYFHNHDPFSVREDNLVDELNWYYEGSETVEKVKMTDVKTKRPKSEPKSMDLVSVGPPKKVIRVDEDDNDSKNEKQMTKLNEGPSLFKQCLSLSDKLIVLEERDRQLRLKLDKVNRLDREGVIKGTCPDMCPEKERILRDVRGIFASYEANPTGDMDHSKAVKEYARSSADQEEPLPHELRPQPVLTMTMNYLLEHIISKIDEGEDNFANWYDFCWGRLRAIRKDIIQQQLCDLKTVTIVEQCARFHIVCYDRLWGMSQSHFDDKINTETLVNCLQSLMHMYEDLRKEGVDCPNQAEFIGYLILLELNSGFLFSEYSRYSSNLQLSKQVKEAVRIHLVYNNNLFSNYFKLTQQTSYLNACLMQRFFHHLRVNALERVIKAHSVPNKVSNISVQFLSDCLKFDYYEDCINFCESCGLSLTKEDKYFRVSRSHFNKPDYVYVSKSSSRLVTNKRIPIVEAVSGENASSSLLLVDHKIHNSFTEEGILQQDAVDASDQEEKMLRDVVERELLSRLKTSKKKTVSPQGLSDISPFKFDSSERKDYTKPHLNSESVIEENDNSLSSEDASFDETDYEEDNEEKDIYEEAEEELDKTDVQTMETTSFPDSIINDPPILQIKESSSLVSPPCVNSSNDLETSIPKDTSYVFSQSETPPNFVFTASQSYPKSKISETVKPFETKVSPSIMKINSSSTIVSNKIEKSSFFTPVYVPPKQLPIVRVEKLEMPKLDLLPESEIKRESTFKDNVKSHKIDNRNAYLTKLRKNLGENMKKVWAKKYLKIWKQKVEKLRLDKELESILKLHTTSTSGYLEVWGKSKFQQNIAVRLTKRLNNRKKNNIMVQILLHSDIIDKMKPSCKKVGEKVRDILGISSVNCAYKWGNVSQPNPVFWKLVFSLPSPGFDGSTFSNKLKKWCQKAFYQLDNRMIESNENDYELQMSSFGVPIFITVKVIEGLSNENLEKYKNVSALIIIRAEDWESTEETGIRLGKILSLCPTPIPVVVLNLGLTLNVIEKPSMSSVSYFNQILWKDSTTMLNVVSKLSSCTLMYNIKVKPFCSVLDVTVEKLFDLMHEDRYIHDNFDNELKNPNKMIKIYNKLIECIEKEIIHCHKLNYYGTACEFREKYNHLSIFPDNYTDQNYQTSISLRCSICKLNEIKWPFVTSVEFLNYFKNYCDNLNCLNVIPRLMRFINPPDEDNVNTSLMQCLNNVNWILVMEIIVNEILKSKLLTFRIVYRQNVINELLNTHWWLNDLVLEEN